MDSGKRLFREGSEKKVLGRVETKMLSSGVMVLTYHPDKSSPGRTELDFSTDMPAALRATAL